MPTFVILGSFTDQGIRKIKTLGPEIRAAAEQWVASKGGRVVANYITFGPYDFVFIAELPSEDVALEGAFTFGAQGDTRSLTMRAFSPQESEEIARRIP